MSYLRYTHGLIAVSIHPTSMVQSHRWPSCCRATHNPIGKEEQKMLKACSPMGAEQAQKNARQLHIATGHVV